MKLYIMRHGPAEDHSVSGRDEDRELTPAGRARTTAVAQALLHDGEAPYAIVSSPLIRALQTAQIVASETNLADRVKESPNALRSGATGAIEIRAELGTSGRPLSMVCDLVRQGRKRIMIVGHEPTLSQLLFDLVGMDGVGQAFGFDKSMVVGLTLREVARAHAGALSAHLSARLRFVLDPKALRWFRP